jgi:hypothetical protein
MEDFDNLSPSYASSHSEEEVLRWFKDAGLIDVRRLGRATAVNGRRAALPTTDVAEFERHLRRDRTSEDRGGVQRADG